MEEQNSANQPEEQISDEQLEQVSGGEAIAQSLEELLDEDPTNPDVEAKNLFFKKKKFFFHRRHGHHGHHGHHH